MQAFWHLIRLQEYKSMLYHAAMARLLHMLDLPFYSRCFSGISLEFILFCGC